MKLLIVDDHPMVRAGIAALLQQAEPGITVLQASDDAEALQVADATPDLAAVFLDLNLNERDGMSALPEFARRNPHLPVIIISSSEEPEVARRSLALGARGYVPKSARAQTLFSALKLVLSGDIYVPPLLLQAIGAVSAGGGAPAVAELTKRQTAILKRLGSGLTNAEIGRELGLSENTVKVHVGSIFKTLHVVNRLQAASVAKQANLV
jgi:DNA-binding NarL/FixJ family response regulator